METQKITSFIIRFIHEDPSDGEKFHRGVISHIQDGDEIGFTQWEDAVAFIRRFVPLEIGTNNDPTIPDKL